jgi:hypothetical protein
VQADLGGKGLDGLLRGIEGIAADDAPVLAEHRATDPAAAVPVQDDRQVAVLDAVTTSTASPSHKRGYSALPRIQSA